MVTAPSVPEATAARLNALMRPAGDVANYSVVVGLLAAVSDAGSEEERIAALAYVFANKPFAQGSGPPTSASEYPPALGLDGRDREALEELNSLERDRGFFRKVFVLGLSVDTDEADVPERARRAWAFLKEQCTTPLAKVFALNLMIQSDSPFLGSATPPAELRYNELLSDDEYAGILWRNRTVIARLDGIRKSEKIKSQHAFADATLTALAEIHDERERAVALGYLLGYFLRGQQDAIEDRAPALGFLSDGGLRFLELIRGVNAAAERGEPCPACGKVHRRGEELEDK
ncbi:MAG: hypothetical protein V1723_00760 [Candidatus Uhrbacteria bacterium]